MIVITIFHTYLAELELDMWIKMREVKNEDKAEVEDKEENED